MGSEQSTESRKSVNEKYQNMYKKEQEEHRKTYEKLYKMKIQEQQMMQQSMGWSERNAPQSTTLRAETQETQVPLYPNVPQVSMDEAQSSISSVNNHAHSSHTHSQYKSIFCESPAPMEPTRETPSMLPTPPTRHFPPEFSTSNTATCSTLEQNNRVQCQQIHSSSSQCMIDEVKCGTSKSSVPTCHHLELSIANLPKNNVKNIEKVRCPNDGCILTMRPEKIKTHLKVCLFREWECPMAAAEYSTCPWQGKINQIKNHVLQNHPEQTGVNVGTEICFDLNVNYYAVYYIAKENFNFLLHVKLDNKLKALLMAVQVVGSPSSASKWSYEFQVYIKSEPRRKFTFTDVCLPTSIQFSDIANEAKCAVLPLLYAFTFFKDNKLTYMFYIKKVGSKTEQ